MYLLIKVVTLFTCALFSVTALECRHCLGETKLEDCQLKVCPSSEIGCYTQKNDLGGQDVIYARCISDHTCTHYSEWRGLSGWQGTFKSNNCCRTDDCNKESIQLALHLIARPSCYVCEGESNLSQCRANQQCPSGQDMCFMQVNRDVSGKVTRYARCMASTTCPFKSETWSQVAHYATDVCEGCCTGDNCNRDLCTGTPPSTGSTPPGTLVAPYRLHTGIRCASCSGGGCGRTGSDAVVHCPNASPYCMSTIENDPNGNTLITKRCASESDCERYWWTESSTKNICSVFDPANKYNLLFSCSYCCLTTECNRDLHPHPSTLYIGKLA